MLCLVQQQELVLQIEVVRREEVGGGVRVWVAPQRVWVGGGGVVGGGRKVRAAERRLLSR